jgi:hypothetical protein
VTSYAESMSCLNGKAGFAAIVRALSSRIESRTPLTERLSPDWAEYFPDEQSVNAALRTLIHAAKGPLCPALNMGEEQGKNKVKSRTL